MTTTDSDLKICFDALVAKRPAHALRWRYYDGDHPIAFVNPKIAQVIPNGVVFKKNWCQVVINATRDRLKILDWTAPDDATSARMDDIWQRVLKRSLMRINVSALTTGEGYIVAWPDATGTPRAYYHDPRQVHVVYDDADPDTPRVACKIWAQDKTHFLNLYYTDRIEHYVSPSEPSVATAYQPAEVPVEANPYGIIPVFRFCIDPRRMTGELTSGLLSLQDAMNKLLNDMMVASEYCSFPQRWGIGHWETGDVLPVGAGTILKIPASEPGDQQNSVGAFPSANPDNYLKPIDSLADAIAVLSATPKHYFTGQGANLSGEALQAMEAPLIAKIELYQECLADEWQRVMAFCLAVEGQSVDAEDIEILWQPPHTVQPQSQATTRLTNTQAGIPIVNLLRDEGWSDDQIAELVADAAMMPAAGAQAPQSAPSGPTGTVDEQAALQQVTIDRQAVAIRSALLTALEATNVELVDRLIKSGALDRMRA